MSRQGDWSCPECSELNFASRNECFKCKCYKSKAFKNQPQEKKKGDWNCNCGELNFASRVACRKCGKNKQPETTQNNHQASQQPHGTNQVNSIKPGDWTCPACNKFNFGTRTVCFGCGKQKEEINIQVEDETCIVCMERNIDTVITTCGHLGYCGPCALNMNKCPVCRSQYNPDADLLKVFKVK